MQSIDLNRLQLELEAIQQELAGLPLSKPDCTIGDFGCGEGYATLSLMLHLGAKECTGVDNGVDKDRAWKLPTIEEARDYFNTGQNVSTGGLSEKVRQLLYEERWPKFQQEDVVDAEKLPNNLDLAYCRKLLTNILNGDYNNSLKGVDVLNRAIKNIVGRISQGGFFCLVETINYSEHLVQFQSDLEFLRVCQAKRRNSVLPFYIHFYKKR